MSAVAVLMVGLFGVGFVGWIIFTVSKAIWDGVYSSVEGIVRHVKANRARREEEKAQAALEREKLQIEEFRQRNPAQIVGLPNLALLKQISDQLDEFIANARLKWPLELLFLRDNSTDDGPDPEPWQTTLDSVVIQAGRPLKSIYNELGVLEAPAQLPKMQLPSWSIKILETETGREIDVRSGIAAQAYAPEIEQVETLRHTADGWQKQINKKLVDAKQVEQQSVRALQPIRDIYKGYLLGTKEGIEQHFSLGLETIVLPVPPRFPWRVFYDRDERLIQLNQRVPFATELVVSRTDSKRPPAKRDVETFLRRYVPAVSLHLASNVAANDWNDHIDTIAVNCWCRYFEKATGRLKDAFVSGLKAEKKDILGININKADAVDAFRALRGAFVFSMEEIVPIEPQIRLDKNDKRFVAGKDILDGMAQGQNLATMDWEDFEHLIRELLAKEYVKEGSDVKITRASRD